MSARSGVGAATAHANIAFSKYWGKRPYPGNYPATPSLSMTLDTLTTRTRVTFDPSLSGDRLEIAGMKQEGRPLARASELLGRVRDASGTRAFAEVVTRADFPVASGLASSASGFAALALAAVRAAGLDWDLGQVSDLARRSSASAARSLHGGFVELRAGPEAPTAEVLSARPAAGQDHVDWRLVVALAGEAEKAVGSTAGMERTRATSPFFEAWLALAPRLHGELLEALAGRDLARFGEATERSALAMHASAFAAGVIYARGVTLEVLSSVRALRASGVLAYATMDAGPHVKVLTGGSDAGKVADVLRGIAGVTRVIEARPGEGARAIDPAGASW